MIAGFHRFPKALTTTAFLLLCLLFIGCERGPRMDAPDTQTVRRAQDAREIAAEGIEAGIRHVQAARRDIAGGDPDAADIALWRAERPLGAVQRLVGGPAATPPAPSEPTERHDAFWQPRLARVTEIVTQDRESGTSPMAADVYVGMKREAAAEASGKEAGIELGKVEAIQNLGLFARVGNKIDGMLRILTWILGGTVLVLIVVGFFFPAVLPVIMQVIGRVIGSIFTLGTSGLGELKAWRQRRIERAALENTIKGVEDFKAERPETASRLGELLEKHQGPKSSPTRTVIRKLKGKVTGEK